ncbi:MAG: DUF151 domain-containing protein [Actinomycetota bacterium]|nr:DUF151 domain-containing protein [Actinomycetota bacterium]
MPLFSDIADQGGRLQAAPDRELVAEALGGDRAAFTSLVGRHHDMVASVCRRVLRGSSVAVEDVLQEAVLTAWLNLNRWRNPDRFGSWLAGIALNGYYLEGLTQVELAALLGTSPGAIKTRLHKARRALRAVLLPALKEDETMASTSAIPMRIATICQTSPTESGIQRYVVILDEQGGNRRLPIWVGEHEGIALAFALEDVPLPRPMTHQLTTALLQAAGSRITGVNITELVEGTYYATITLDTPSGRQKVDARPSDAMILALLSGARVAAEAYILDQAMELHAATPPSAEDVERHALAQTRQIVATRMTEMQELKASTAKGCQ